MGESLRCGEKMSTEEASMMVEDEIDEIRAADSAEKIHHATLRLHNMEQKIHYKLRERIETLGTAVNSIFDDFKRRLPGLNDEEIADIERMAQETSDGLIDMLAMEPGYTLSFERPMVRNALVMESPETLNLGAPALVIKSPEPLSLGAPALKLALTPKVRTLEKEEFLWSFAQPYSPVKQPSPNPAVAGSPVKVKDENPWPNIKSPEPQGVKTKSAMEAKTESRSPSPEKKRSKSAFASPSPPPKKTSPTLSPVESRKILLTPAKARSILLSPNAVPPKRPARDPQVKQPSNKHRRVVMFSDSD